MRVNLELDRIQARGAESLRQPTVWPVWFAVDGDALRHLLGDPGAREIVHAPGPASAGEPLTWNRELVAGGLTDSATGIGFGLLYTEGGATLAETRARYDALAARARRLAITLAARASGLGLLLSAFGAVCDDALPDAAALAAGIDLDAIDDDTEAAESAAGFRHVAALLARVSPGSTTLHTGVDLASMIAAPAAPSPTTGPTRLAPSIDPRVAMSSVDPGRITRPPLVTPPLTTLPPSSPPVTRTTRPVPTRPTLSTLPDGTVVASLVQFWPAALLAERPSLLLRRTLAARTALRASLTLIGTLRLED